MAIEGGGDYRQRLAQRQLQIKKRKQAGLSDTRADAGPPSSKTFSSPPKTGSASLNRFASQGVSSRDDKIITYGGKAMAFAAPNIPAIIRGITDPVGTAKGVAEVSSYTNPATLIQRGVNAYRGEGFTKSLTGANAEDIEQAVEIAGIIPYGKVAKAASVFGKYAPDFYRNFAESSRVMGITPQPPRLRTAAPGVDMDKEKQKAQDWLIDVDWKPGRSTTLQTREGIIEYLNWGPELQKYKKLSPRIADPQDIVYLNPKELNNTELDAISEIFETDNPIETLDALRIKAKESDDIIRGAAEPATLKVTKLPTWQQFNARLSGPRFRGWTSLDMDLRKEIYEDALDWLNNNDAYWRIERVDPETGYTVKGVVGGVDMEHGIHFSKGGGALTPEGQLNVTPGLPGPNRMQGDIGIGGQLTGGFDAFLEKEVLRRHNKASLYTFDM